MHALKPFPSYRESGIPSFGDVPENWEVRKLRHILRRASNRYRPELSLLSVVREKGVIVRDISNRDENHNIVPDDLTNYKVVEKFQFAMNKMKAWQGSYGVSNHLGIVSPAYFVFDIQGVGVFLFFTEQFDPRFTFHISHELLTASGSDNGTCRPQQCGKSHFSYHLPRHNPPSSASSTTPTGASGAPSEPSRS